MTSRTALFALLAIWGVGTCASLPAIAEPAAAESPTEESDSSTLRDLTNRVWVKEDDSGLPGTMRIFLSDGTLVQDSCWETHRLSEWTMTAENVVSWNEDGVEIAAEIVSVSADRLTLSLKLGKDVVEEHYSPAPVPYVCPDFPK